MAKGEAKNETAMVVDHMTLNPEQHPDWETWPLQPEAARRLNVSGRTVARYVREGELIRYLCPDETYRYNPAQVKAIQFEQAHQRSELVAGAVGMRGLEDFESGEGGPPALGIEGAVLARWSMQHTEEMARLMTAPMKTSLDCLQKENQQLRKELGEMRQQVSEQWKSASAIVMQDHERRKDLMKAEASERRKDALLDMVKAQFPNFVTHLGAAVGRVMGAPEPKSNGSTVRNPAKDPHELQKRALAAFELVNTLDESRVNALLNSEVLNQRQRQLFLTALGRDASANDQSSEHQNGVIHDVEPETQEASASE